MLLAGYVLSRLPTGVVGGIGGRGYCLRGAEYTYCEVWGAGVWGYFVLWGAIIITVRVLRYGG